MFSSLALILATETSGASQLPLEFSAESVNIEGPNGVNARGDVHVDVRPFYLTSDELSLARTSAGVIISGSGLVSLCPCLGTPISLSFDGARVAPPDDLIVKSPTLSLFGVPFAWLPAFWLRSPSKFGVLPPELAYRGGDGVLVGEGAHIPWEWGDATSGLDVRGGAYVHGGAKVEGALSTDRSSTHVIWDDLGTSGITVDSRGVVGSRSQGAWEIDAMRGARSVAATSNLGEATLRFDHARASATLLGTGWVVTSGVRVAALRGSALFDASAAGPYVGAAGGGTVGPLTFSLAAESGLLRGSSTEAISYGTARLQAHFDERFGPLLAAVRASARTLLTETGDSGASALGGELRSTLRLPLYRAFDSGVTGDPRVHILEPRVEMVELLGTTSSSALALSPPTTPLPFRAAVLGLAGLRNALGRASGEGGGSELDLAVGGVADGVTVRPLLRARGAATFDAVSFMIDGGQTLSRRRDGGGAWVLRSRLGPEPLPHAQVALAERDGADPTLSRVLMDSVTAPGTFLSTVGWTGRGHLVVPVTSGFAARMGADVDISSSRIMATGGGFDLRDRTGCFVVHADATHRVGREGVDVWVSMDIPLAEAWARKM